MTAQEEDAVEAVARAICRANCGPVMRANEPERVECQVENGWDMWIDEACAAILAYQKATGDRAMSWADEAAKMARDEAIEECAKLVDAEGLRPDASASYRAATLHIGMCIRSLKSSPGEKS